MTSIRTDTPRARAHRAIAGSFSLLLAALPACDVPAPSMHTAHVFHEDDLQDSPIPREWIRAGNPRARAKQVVEAERNGTRAVIWECSAGEFSWYFNHDEFVHILAGSVSITDEQGRTRTLQPGNVAYFQAGMHSVWRIDKYVKKLALVDDEQPSLVWRARRKLGKLYGSL